MLKWIAVAAAVAAAGPAFAASLPAPAEKTLSAARVDFQDRAATAAFYARLRQAAEVVCDGYAENSRVTREAVACADRSVAAAVRKLDRPTLTALHERRTDTRLARR